MGQDSLVEKSSRLVQQIVLFDHVLGFGGATFARVRGAAVN
jgi:hypothetical protein